MRTKRVEKSFRHLLTSAFWPSMFCGLISAITVALIWGMDFVLIPVISGGTFVLLMTIQMIYGYIFVRFEWLSSKTPTLIASVVASVLLEIYLHFDEYMENGLEPSFFEYLKNTISPFELARGFGLAVFLFIAVLFAFRWFYLRREAKTIEGEGA